MKDYDAFDEFVEDKNNNNKVKQYVEWLKYQIGFSGCGTTALDQKPDFDMPELPDSIKEILIDEAKKIAKFRWESWKKIIMEELDEDLDSEQWIYPKLG